MLRAEPATDRGVFRVEPQLLGGAGDDPQRIQDHHDVDALLEERTPRCRQPPGGSNTHREQGEAHADDDALPGDPKRAPRDPERIAQTIEAIHRQHDIGHFRRRGRAAAADRRRPRPRPRGRERR